MLPYLRSADIHGMHRCYFKFYSPDTVSMVERYRYNKRYRFNRWVPLSDFTPTPSQYGLKFSFSDKYPLLGMDTAQVLPVGGSGYGSVYFSKMDYTLLKSSGFIEVGIGIRAYRSPYWWPLDSFELSVRRSHNKVLFHGLRSELIQQQSSGVPIISGKFEASINGNQLTVVFTEFTLDGTVINTYSKTITGECGPYSITVFGRAQDGKCETLMVKSELSGFPCTRDETIQFIENPEIFNIVDAPLRAASINIYPQPHTAYIEDADIKMSSHFCNTQWFNILKLIIDGTVEPFYFYDIEGREWLVCMSDLSGQGRRGFLGRQNQGYDLTLPVLVVH